MADQYILQIDKTEYVAGLEVKVTELQGNLAADAIVIEGLQETIRAQQIEIENLKKQLEEPGERVLFETDFEDVSIGPFPHPVTGMEGIKALPGVSDFVFNISREQYTIAAIRPDPIDPNNKCLYGEVIADDPNGGGTSRFQCSWRFNEGWNRYHVQYRMYLSPDIARLENYTGLMDWFTLLEMWEQHNPSMDGDVSGQARWIFALYKASGTGKLCWKMDGVYMQPANLQNKHIWPIQYNKDVPVPFGRWFTLDFLMERGQADTGHILISIIDNGLELVLFDIHNYTEYPQNPLPIWAFNIFKLYANMSYVSFIRQSGGKVYAYYDDLKILE